MATVNGLHNEREVREVLFASSIDSSMRKLDTV